MTTAESWNFASPGKAYRPSGGWAERPRYAPVDFVSLLWRERWLMIGVFVVLFAIGFGAALTMKTSYTAYSSVLVRMGDEYVYQPRAGDAGRGAVPESDAVVASEVEILMSSQLKERVIRRVGLNVLYPKLKTGSTQASQTEAMAKAVRAFEQNFEIGTAPDLPTIKLSFEHENAALAARTLNALMDEYLIYRRSILIDSAAPALKVQKETSAAQLAATDAAYQAFLNLNDIGDFDAEKTALSQLLIQLEQQRYTLESSLREKQARLTALNSQLAGLPAEAPLYRDLNLKSNETRDELLRKRAELLSRYTPDSTPVREMDQQIAELNRSLSALPPAGDAARRLGPNPVYQTLQTEKIQVTAEVAALRQSLAAVTEQVRQVTDRQLRLATLEPQFQGFARDRTILQDNVRDFTDREQESLAQAAIAAQGADNIRIVGRATPPVQGSSPKKIVAALALIFAAFTALVVGLLVMFLKGGVSTPATAARTLGLPVLATARVKG